MVPGTIDYQNDEDFFGFSLTEGSAYRIEIRNLMACCPCVWLDLLNEGLEFFGQAWTCDDSQAWQGFVYFVPAGAGGNYYLRVAGEYEGTPLLYEVRVSEE